MTDAQNTGPMSDRDELPWDEAGCSRYSCQNGHSHTWGRCAYGVEPEPTLSRFDVVTAQDGETSGIYSSLNAEQVADWLHEQGYTVEAPARGDR